MRRKMMKDGERIEKMSSVFSILIGCLVTMASLGQEPHTINEKFDNSAYFEFNEITNFENLTLDYLRDLIRKFPDICIEFKQGLNPLESNRVARKSMKQFERMLLSNEITPRNFQFNKKFFYLTDAYSVDQRSRIEGKVLSLTETCK